MADLPPPRSTGAHPPSSSSSASSSSSGASSSSVGVHLSDASADRLLAERLSRLLAPTGPVRIANLPPPSTEQLQQRLTALAHETVTTLQPAEDEEQLQRRFARLQGGGFAGDEGSPQPSATHAAAPGALLGVPSSRTDIDEVDALLAQMQQHTRLEQSFRPPTVGGHGATALCARDQAAAPTATSSSPSPPPPSRAEVDSLLLELQSLPDTTILARAHQASDAQARTQRRAQAEADDDTASDDSDVDADDIVAQAMDEARMGL